MTYNNRQSEEYLSISLEKFSSFLASASAFSCSLRLVRLFCSTRVTLFSFDFLHHGENSGSLINMTKE